MASLNPTKIGSLAEKIRDRMKETDDNYQLVLNELKGQNTKLHERLKKEQEQRLEDSRQIQAELDLKKNEQPQDFFDIQIKPVLYNNPSPVERVVALIGSSGKTSFLYRYCNKGDLKPYPTKSLNIKQVSKLSLREANEDDSSNSTNLGIVFIDTPTDSTGFVQDYVAKNANTLILFQDGSKNECLSSSELKAILNKFEGPQNKQKDLIVIHNYSDVKDKRKFEDMIQRDIMVTDNIDSQEGCISDIRRTKDGLNYEIFTQELEGGRIIRHYALANYDSALGKFISHGVFYDITQHLFSTTQDLNKIKNFNVLSSFSTPKIVLL